MSECVRRSRGLQIWPSCTMTRLNQREGAWLRQTGTRARARKEASLSSQTNRGGGPCVLVAACLHVCSRVWVCGCASRCRSATAFKLAFRAAHSLVCSCSALVRVLILAYVLAVPVLVAGRPIESQFASLLTAMCTCVPADRQSAWPYIIPMQALGTCTLPWPLPAPTS